MVILMVNTGILKRCGKIKMWIRLCVVISLMRCEMNQIKIGKASGPSGDALEMFKAGGDKCLKYLNNTFNILLKDEIPEEWMLSSFSTNF